MIIIISFLIFNICRTQKIAFGSCYNYQDPDSLIFFEISKHNPDVFIWLGDAAYVTNKDNRMPELNSLKIEYKFNLTKSNPGYQILMNNTKIHGIWDDHDYNQRDGIYSNPAKEMTRNLYLNFLDVSNLDVRRKREDGIYYSFFLNKTKIILLDVRWNRNPQTQDVLGQNQWNWLINELNDNQAELFIIGSGSQILPNDVFILQQTKRLFIDVWYQESRDKLIKLLEGKNVLLITGDVHFGEIMQDPCSNIIEVTSSGLSLASHYRSILRGLFEFFAEIWQPDSYSQYYERFADKNYAILDIQNQTIQLYNESELLIEAKFSKKSTITCDSLQSSQHFFRYFWNFWNKIIHFKKMLLFKQLIVLLLIGIFLFIIIGSVILLMLMLFGYQIIKKQKKRNNKGKKKVI